MEIVYLAGISRGGALAVRLGKKIRRHHADYPKIYISTIDGHVKADQNELYSIEAAISNPTNENRLAWFAYINDYLISRAESWQGNPADLPEPPEDTDLALISNVHIFNTVAGCEPLGPLDMGDCGWRRTYCSGTYEANTVDTRNVTNLWGYFTQEWADYSHEVICEEWKTDVGPRHVSWFFDRAFGYQPP